MKIQRNSFSVSMRLWFESTKKQWKKQWNFSLEINRKMICIIDWLITAKIWFPVNVFIQNWNKIEQKKELIKRTEIKHQNYNWINFGQLVKKPVKTHPHKQCVINIKKNLTYYLICNNRKSRPISIFTHESRIKVGIFFSFIFCLSLSLSLNFQNRLQINRRLTMATLNGRKQQQQIRSDNHWVNWNLEFHSFFFSS